LTASSGGSIKQPFGDRIGLLQRGSDCRKLAT